MTNNLYKEERDLLQGIETLDAIVANAPDQAKHLQGVINLLWSRWYVVLNEMEKEMGK